MSYRRVQFVDDYDEAEMLLSKPAYVAYQDGGGGSDDDDSDVGSYTHYNAATWATDLYSLPNLIIASSYLNIGIAINFLPTPLSIYRE